MATISVTSVLPGDIFACWGTSLISRGISLETSLTSWLTGPPGLKLSPSHVAIAARADTNTNADCCWFESTTLAGESPCLRAGVPVVGVQVHSVASRIADYCRSGGVVVQYRLTDIDALDRAESARLTSMLTSYCGSDDKPPVGYDAAGACFSGLRIAPLLPFARANLETMFCSELIAAVLQRLCRMNRCNPATCNPGRLLRRLVRQGTYRHAQQYTDRGTG